MRAEYYKASSRGFTLIELVVVVAIVAILASVAFNTYSTQVRKSIRVDAKDALTRAAVIQERRFFQTNEYITSDVDDGLEKLGFTDEVSLDGFYNIAVASGPCNDDTCFILTATALGDQLADLQCRTLSITNTLQRTSTNSTGAVNNPDICW